MQRQRIKKFRIGFLVLLLLGGCLSSNVQAHHSALATFNMDERAEIEGVVTDVHWKNPHIRFTVAVANANGELTQWNIELSALSSFRNRGYSNAFMQVGEQVKVFGHPGHRGRPVMAGLNMLLENGTEVVLEVSEGPYYAQLNNAEEFIVDTSGSEVERLARESADGIFRVWSTAVDDPDFPMFRGGYPLTKDADEAKSAWIADEQELESCWSKSMPYLMITPQPIEFVRSGDNILLRFEEDDAERLIDMSGSNEARSSSLFGYSTGRWDEVSLVVETSNIKALNFDDRGIPQSASMHLIERFTPSDNGTQMDYQITISDPATFTESFELQRLFVWRPERAIVEWDCDA